MGQFQVQMPDGTVKSVQGTTLSAAINNAGAGASAPGSQSSSSPASVRTATPQASSAPAQSSQYGGQQGNWTTINGQRTVPQMAAELAAVGYNGPTDAGSIVSAYGRTTGQTVSAGAPTAAGSTSTVPVPAVAGPAGPPLNQVTNLDANAQLLDNAQKVAYQTYLNAKLALDTDTAAFAKATQAFTNEVTKAGLTGTYNGQQTQQAQLQQFNETQAAAKQAADIAAQQAATGLARDTQTQKTANDYLTLISNLKGPGNYGQYLRTLGSTPGGLRDLVSSAAGQYTPASGATTGVAPVGASLGGLVGDAATGTGGGTTYADYMNSTAALPAPNQISPAAWNAYTSSQKALLLGAYQSNGWNPADVQDLYNQSLPKYSLPAGATGTVKV